MRTLTWSQVYARRLAQSSLDVPAPGERLLEVVRATCGVHAQLTTGAELAISARVQGVTRDDVREALWQSRELVKANTLRTTLHLPPPASSRSGSRWAWSAGGASSGGSTGRG